MSSTLLIEADDQRFPRSRDDGFDYERGANTILFFGAQPGGGRSRSAPPTSRSSKADRRKGRSQLRSRRLAKGDLPREQARGHRPFSLSTGRACC